MKNNHIPRARRIENRIRMLENKKELNIVSTTLNGGPAWTCKECGVNNYIYTNFGQHLFSKFGKHGKCNTAGLDKQIVYYQNLLAQELRHIKFGTYPNIINNHLLDDRPPQQRKFIIHLLSMLPKVVLNDKMDDYLAWKIDKNVVMTTVNLPQIEHEIAHLVEMNKPTNWVKDNFGWGKLITPSEKNSFKAFLREVRVRVIQTHITKNIKEFNYFFTNRVWLNIGMKNCPLKFISNEKELNVWTEAYSNRISKQWNKDRIEHEWKIRADYINNWMATSNPHV